MHAFSRFRRRLNAVCYISFQVHIRPYQYIAIFCLRRATDAEPVRASINEERTMNRIDSKRLFFMNRLEVSYDGEKMNHRRHL